jgi:hypothetical protein
MKSTDPLLDTQTARKMAMLLEEIAIKENELRETRDIIYRKDLVLADLEEQLKRRGDASVVRELNHQLRQMVLVHRQLLRKVRCCCCWSQAWNRARCRTRLRAVCCVSRELAVRCH